MPGSTRYPIAAMNTTTIEMTPTLDACGIENNRPATTEPIATTMAITNKIPTPHSTNPAIWSTYFCASPGAVGHTFNGTNPTPSVIGLPPVPPAASRPAGLRPVPAR